MVAEAPQRVQGRDKAAAAYMEAMQLGSARRKKSAGFSLDDQDSRLLAKYPPTMSLTEVEEKILYGGTSEEGDVEGIEEQKLPTPQEVDEDDTESEELPPEPPDIPPPSEPLITDVINEEEEPEPEEVVIYHPIGDPETGPSQILSYLTSQWKMDWVNWEPETIFTEIEKAYSVSPPVSTQEKILAMSVLYNSQAFWEDWQAFQAVTVALAGRQARFDDVQIVSLPEMMASVRMAQSLGAPHTGEVVSEFSPEVLGYIAATAANEGIVYLPEPLHVAQNYLNSLSPQTVVDLDTVAAEWRKYSALAPGVASAMPIDESPLGVQIARLLALKSASDDILGV